MKVSVLTIVLLLALLTMCQAQSLGGGGRFGNVRPQFGGSFAFGSSRGFGGIGGRRRFGTRTGTFVCIHIFRRRSSGIYSDKSN